MSCPGPTFYSPEALRERVIHATREVIFFFGSALSLPEVPGAPGVPGVRDVLALVEAKLSDSPDAFAPVRSLTDVGAAYRRAFEQLQAFRGQDAANAVIREAVLEARKPSDLKSEERQYLTGDELCRALDEDLSGWHLCPALTALGKLLADRSGRLGKVVLTTNFDPLIEVAISSARGSYFRTTLHTDGVLSQSDGPAIQVVHLHGYWYGTDTLHVPAQIGSPRERLKRSLERLLQNRTLVIVGSGGWDDVFMSALSDLVSDAELNPDVLWAFYESAPTAILQAYPHIFPKLAPAIARGRVHFYSGVNVHTFLPDLLAGFRITPDVEEQKHVNEVLERLDALAPHLRHQVLAKIDPSLIEKVENLTSAHDALAQQLSDAKDGSQAQVEELEAKTARLSADLQQAQAALTSSRLALTSAAMKDLAWLTAIRTKMMPPQPGRVPFHNSLEVALRGFHAGAGARVKPLLRDVTWSLVGYTENGLHRGYRAALKFSGEHFVPGIVYTSRRRGEGLPAGHSDYFWRLPNIYFGDYLEVSANDNPPEAPLNFRDYEFQLRNPEGHVSDWVPFSYTFDDPALTRLGEEAFGLGTKLLEEGRPVEAVEPLRKAFVFSDRMLGMNADETLAKKAVWNRAIDEAALSRLRFRQGDRLRVTSGEHEGRSGVVEELLLRHFHAYRIKESAGADTFQASDEQVERA